MNTQDENANYRKKFMELMGIGSGIDFSFISKESMKNQFCSDLYTKVGQQIQVPHTTIHVFYSKRWVKSIENVMKNISNNLISLNLI